MARVKLLRKRRHNANIRRGVDGMYRHWAMIDGAWTVICVGCTIRDVYDQLSRSA